MTRAYRFLVTVYLEGDRDGLLDILELADHVATAVQDEDDHDLSVCVRPLETEDYPTAQAPTQAAPAQHPGERRYTRGVS